MEIISCCYGAHGAENVVFVTLEFGADTASREKFEAQYNAPKTRKRFFRKVAEVIFEGTKAKLVYSKSESISRVKRFTQELIDALAGLS